MFIGLLWEEVLKFGAVGQRSCKEELMDCFGQSLEDQNDKNVDS